MPPIKPPRATTGFAYNAKVPYMTANEKSTFDKDRASGRITFFRSAPCEREGCKEEVLKGKRFCSKVHAGEQLALEAARATAKALIKEIQDERAAEEEEEDDMLPEMIEVSHPLFEVDKVDSQGEMVPRVVAEELIEAFNKAMNFVPVTQNFDPRLPSVGRVTALWLEGNVVMCKMQLTEDGAKLVNDGAESALGAIGEIDDKDGVRTFTEMRLQDVGLTKEKVK